MRTTTSIKIEPELWKEVKKYCIDKEMNVSALIEQQLKKVLSNMKTK